MQTFNLIVCIYYANILYLHQIRKLNIKLMALSIEDRKFIREKLPYGSQKEIARNIGVSKTTVYQYLSGLRNSERIEKAVVSKFEEVQKNHDELRKRIYG